MAVIYLSAREFRSKQAEILDLADDGYKIVIRRKHKSYLLVPIEDEDLTITEEMKEKIDKATEEIKRYCVL